MQFSSVRLVSNDLPALADQYRKLLGVEPTGNADFVELRSGGLILAISTHQAVISFNAGAASPAANHSAILEFEVTDVDAQRSRLDGVFDLVMEPTTQPWGNRSTLFRDRDGNLINIFSRPSQA